MMFNFLNKTYQGLKTVAKGFKKAYDYKYEELNSGLEKFERKKATLWREEMALKRRKEEEEDNTFYFKRKIGKRYFENLKRIVYGKELLQEEESSYGVKFDYDNGSEYIIVDEEKHEEAKKTLEEILKKERIEKNNGNGTYLVKEEVDVVPKTNKKTKTNNYTNQTNKHNKNNNDYTNTEYFAAYISSFREDCFTNYLANMSSNQKGTVKDVADSLAGYVSNNKELVAPSKRSWNKRISELETLLEGKSFTENEKEHLLKIKDALSSNKYLTKNKKTEYKKAVSLINKAVKEGSYERA